MNLIETLEREAIETDQGQVRSRIPPWRHAARRCEVIEGDRTRVQASEVCIARPNKGVGSSFTVRKISFGEGVECVFRSIRRSSIRSRSCAAATCAGPSLLPPRPHQAAARIAERRTIQRDVPGGKGAEAEVRPRDTTREERSLKVEALRRLRGDRLAIDQPRVEVPGDSRATAGRRRARRTAGSIRGPAAPETAMPQRIMSALLACAARHDAPTALPAVTSQSTSIGIDTTLSASTIQPKIAPTMPPATISAHPRGVAKTRRGSR